MNIIKTTFRNYGLVPVYWIICLTVVFTMLVRGDLDGQSTVTTMFLGGCVVIYLDGLITSVTNSHARVVRARR